MLLKIKFTIIFGTFQSINYLLGFGVLWNHIDPHVPIVVDYQFFIVLLLEMVVGFSWQLSIPHKPMLDDVLLALLAPFFFLQLIQSHASSCALVLRAITMQYNLYQHQDSQVVQCGEQSCTSDFLIDIPSLLASTPHHELTRIHSTSQPCTPTSVIGPRRSMLLITMGMQYCALVFSSMEYVSSITICSLFFHSSRIVHLF